jgi:hypothetical protein
MNAIGPKARLKVSARLTPRPSESRPVRRAGLVRMVEDVHRGDRLLERGIGFLVDAAQVSTQRMSRVGAAAQSDLGHGPGIPASEQPAFAPRWYAEPDAQVSPASDG